jgi:septum formation protein
MPSQKLILASQSQTRIKLLANAGLNFVVQSAPANEEALKQNNRHLNPPELAQFLAREKALSVSITNLGHYILGADQTLNLNGQCFNKATNQAEAYEHLKALRGKTHALHTAISIIKDNTIVFEHVETATLTMRNFTDAYLDSYLQQTGSEILHSVGCYHYEGLGIQLFEKVEGDYSTILGLPLLPLLAFLRKIGIVAL